MVFKTVILSVRELKSKNSNCLSGHSPQPREPGLPDCLQRLLSHCVLFKVRKHTHTDHVTPQRSDVCEGLMTLHLFYAHSNLPEDSWRRLRVCVCKCLRMSVWAFTSDYVHHYGCFVIQFPGCDLLSVISLDFDLWPWPSRGWSEYHFLWKPCSLSPPSRRCHMVYTHYRGCIWICPPLPTKFYNYGNVFRLPDFIPLFLYWFLHFLFFFFFQ